MTSRSLPSVSQAFARIAWRTVVGLLVFATTLFALASQRLMRMHERDHLQQQATICASMIRSGDPSEFRDLAAGLAVHNPEFVAVAVTSESGAIEAVYPDSPAHRSAAQGVLNRDVGARVKAASIRSGRMADMVAVAMPVQESCVSRREVFAIFEMSAHAQGLLTILFFFGLLTGVTALVAFVALRRWFDRHVASPLRTFSTIAADGKSGSRAGAALNGNWEETARLAEVFRELTDSLAETDARARKLEAETLQKLKDRQAGFDRQLRRVRDQATIDPLTRLRNRAYLEEALPTVFDAMVHQGRALAAIMLDVDNFKSYNDTHGHQAGDALLRFVGALLRGSLRPTDHAIRYGGDEFLLLLPQTDVRQATTIAERVSKLFGQYSSCLEQGEKLSISAGVAAVPDEPCADVEDLIAKADHALYSAKGAGKNGVAVSSSKRSENAPVGGCAARAKGATG